MLRRYRKGIALVLLLTFGQEIFMPSTIWALTGGPSQPEVNSFEPVGTNQMVDLSTGDFNYNIPLMVVPGPNGGYPINLAYHAGIGMEQEASWVGLGWNINPGAITRNLRGVPDDFSGDEVEQKLNLKNNVTTGLNFPFGGLSEEEKEFFGYDTEAYIPKWSLSTYYNNYTGVGYTVSPSPIKLLWKATADGKSSAFKSALNLSFDSQTGLDAEMRFSPKGVSKLFKREFYGGGRGLSLGWNTNEGLQSIRFSSRRIVEQLMSRNGSMGYQFNFASSSYFPQHDFSMSGFNTATGITISKKDALGEYSRKLKVDGQYIQNRVKEKEKTLKAFGTLYLGESEVPEYSKDDWDYLQDVNVSNDVPVTKRSKNMGVPIGTSDIYVITGQGIGGSFRAHRNDIGRYHSSGTSSQNLSAPGAIEFGIGPHKTDPTTTVLHAGWDGPVTLGGTWSYSGKLKKGNEQIANLDFENESTQNPGHEPVYFKMSGEHTAVPSDQWDYMNGFDTTCLEIGLKWFEGGGPAPVPNFKNRVVGLGGESGHLSNEEAKNKDRIKRVQSIQYLTKADIIDDENYTNRPDHIYGIGAIPGLDGGSPVNYQGTGGLNSDEGLSHIHEYEIVQPDGSIYKYGLPAYNTVQVENVFSNTSAVDIPSAYDDADLVSYDPSDASIDNNEGLEHYYSSNGIPAYVHSHLITQINSADYVDLTGDGPSEDDLGFYAKFNYTVGVDYKWREPFYNADYIKGMYSNESDDKSSFVYGEKQLHYVQSIETKTHVAIFELGDREDGIGVSEIHQTPASALGANQKYLKNIKLYSKKDLEEADELEIPIEDVKPLQTVHFKYSYELCPGVLNNSGDSPEDYPNNFVTAANAGGKLTLKEVYITYNGNEKGRLSPYKFNYTSNQDYSRLNLDRWGNYQESEGDNEHEINPYTRQSLTEAERIENASAWCLSQIDLPSGGTLRIDYEQDNYGYVQDQRAAQMIEILGFTNTETTEAPIGEFNRKKLKKKHLRLWFKADALNGVSVDDRDAVIAGYVEDLKQIYFKVFTELKRPEGGVDYAKDYVVGYATVDVEKADYYGADIDDDYGYVDLVAEDYKSMGLDLFKTHPIRKAAWQYLRYSRSDLFNNLADLEATDASEEFWSAFDLMFDSVEEAVAFLSLGQYNRYAIWNYCKLINTSKKSFVRLNSPNYNKYGGGHRVKGIYLSDNWVEGDRDFGTEYSYTNEDGSTSGVADYEPMVGGDENALKQPKWYNPNDQLINFQHQDLYLEEPLMEALYPAPRVVYGRVVQMSTGHLPDEIPPGFSTEDSETGATVFEFYTAKDFPVIETHTGLKHKGYNIPVYIPYVGFTSFNNNGFSQGYKLELNDMSGKQKAISVYPYSADFVNDQPISKTEYVYRTESKKSDRDKGRLNNLVDVLDGHGEVRKALVGVEMDFSVYEEENSSHTTSTTLEGNLDMSINATTGLVLPVPTAWPKVNYSQFMYRGVSTSKVIYRSGILEKVIVTTDGSAVSTENKLYDAETGEALLSTVDNEWDEPVYNYNYAAHWNYERMGGAYENYRANVWIRGLGISSYLVESNGGSTISHEGVLSLGDEITVNDGGTLKTYYVSEFLDDTYFHLEDSEGNVIEVMDGSVGKEGYVTRSGRRNMQAIKSGTIVALSDNFLSISGELSPFFLAWNNAVTGADPQEGEDYGIPDKAPYIDKNTGEEEEYDWYADRIFLPNVYDCDNSNYSNCYLECSEADYLVRKIYIRSAVPGHWASLTFSGVNPMDDGYIHGVAIDEFTTSFTEQLVDFRIVSESRDGSGAPVSAIMEHIPTGNLYNVNIVLHGPWSNCDVADILHADATVFSEDWVYPYGDLGDLFIADGITPISDADINEYRYGKKGIWRVKRTYLYQIPRKQSGANPSQTRTNIDGEYEPWEPYSWLPGQLNPKWDWVSEITRYSPYGFAIEEKSRLNNGLDNPATEVDERTIYSGQLYGYNNSVVIATSALSSYYEFGYTGFEQGTIAEDLNNTGHINIETSGSYDVVGNKSHTGSNSLKILNLETAKFSSDVLTISPTDLSGIQGKQYVVSMWVNVEESGSFGTITIDNGVISKTVSTEDSREIIDGWKKLEISFIMEGAEQEIVYQSNGTTYIDDLRFGPYDGGMMTYVYDRDNLWLLAELDGLNYATFYNYDEEGNLVQVKKETEEGIVTIKIARSNTVQLP